MHKVGISQINQSASNRQRSFPGIDFRGSQNSLWFKTALGQAEKNTGKKGVLDSQGRFTNPDIQRFVAEALRRRVKDAAIQDRASAAPKRKVPKKPAESLRRKSTRRLLALGAAAKDVAKGAALGSKDLVVGAASSFTEMALLPFEIASEGFQSFINRREIAEAKAREAELLDKKIPPERIIHSGNPSRPAKPPVQLYKPSAHEVRLNDYMDDFFKKHGITEDDDLRKVFPDPGRQKRQEGEKDFSNSMYGLENDALKEPKQVPPNADFENSLFGETQYEADDPYADYADFDPDADPESNEFDWLNNTLYDD